MLIWYSLETNEKKNIITNYFRNLNCHEGNVFLFLHSIEVNVTRRLMLLCCFYLFIYLLVDTSFEEENAKSWGVYRDGISI